MATKIVNKNTVVTPVRMSSIVNVTYNSPDPTMAATIANSIAEHFVESNLTRRYESAAYARQFLQNRLNHVRAGSKNRNARRPVCAAAGPDQNPHGARCGRPNNRSSPMTLPAWRAIAMARAQRAQADRFRAGAGGNIAAQSLSNQTLGDLRRQRANCSGSSASWKRFRTEYPTVVALRSQITELERQIGREEGGSARRFRRTWAGATAGRSKRASAAGACRWSEGAAARRAGRSIQYNIIQRDVDTNRALYDALLQRFKEVGVAGGIGTNNISIVDRALPPKQPFKPNFPLNIAIGLVLGLLCGAGVAVLLENMEDSLSCCPTTSTASFVPLLGVTPRLVGDTDVRTAWRTEVAAGRGLFLDPDVASVLNAARHSEITDADQCPGSGRQVDHVAGSVARSGEDGREGPADRCRYAEPVRAQVVRPAAGPGPEQSFDRQRAPHRLYPAIRHSEPIGPGGRPDPAEPRRLLSADAIIRIVDEASKRFDHVIIDGPPVLGLADAPLLSRAVEGTVLVIEAGRTPATRARHAVDRLFGVRTHIIGAILSKFDLKTTGYGYGYGYGYEYHYGPATMTSRRLPRS